MFYRPVGPPQNRLSQWAGFSVLLAVLLTGCVGPGPADVALVNMEAVTYVNAAVTFTVAVVGGGYDSLELVRDGELFEVLTSPSYTWDVSAVPEGSYKFLARVRRGSTVLDSAAKVVVVDRTPPTVSLAVATRGSPLLQGTAQVDFSVTGADAVALASVELLDGDDAVHVGSADFDLQLTPPRGVHRYGARATDAAGNQALTTVTTVPVYVRETHSLSSDAALDGCVSAGYELALFERTFDAANCTWTTSWSILHFFSFDRSAYPDALVESAVLSFDVSDSYNPFVYVASVVYPESDAAPPTSFIYPFVSTVTESTVELASASPTMRQTVDVTALVQADVAAGRPGSQVRLRTEGMGPGALGGLVYFSEVGDDRVPTLTLDLLVP